MDEINVLVDEEENEDEKEGEEEVEEELDKDVVLMPDRKLRVQLKRQCLRCSLGSGRYLEYLGFEGLYSGQTDVLNDSALDYLQMLWPEFLVDVIVHATNKCMPKV